MSTKEELADLFIMRERLQAHLNKVGIELQQKLTELNNKPAAEPITETKE